MKSDFSKDYYFTTWWLLHQARYAIFRARSSELSQYDISVEKAAVLFIINILSELNEKITPGEISKWILKEPNAVSKILTRMEKDGLVIKNTGLGKKKNEVHVNLTETGMQAYNRSIKRDSIHEIMSCLTKEECSQLGSFLERIRDKALQTLTKEPRAFFP